MKSLLIGINSKYIHPAMGIFQIATNSLYPLDFKEFTIKDKINDIIQYIYEQEFDILGFSVYIWNVELIKNILKKLNNVNKIVVLGGPEVSYNAKEFLLNYNIDYIIKNEGEESYNELLDALINHNNINNVSNLYYKIDNEVYFTYEKNPDLSKIKHDYSLINDFKNRIIYLEASRGCYFRCSYCLASLEKQVRFFDLQTTKNELLFLLSNNVKTIKFLDRSFNVDKNHMLEILKFINDHDNNYTTFQFEVVGDLLSDDVIDYIKTMRKDYLRFEIGIQSFNNKTIYSVQRTQNFDKLKNNIIKLRDYITIHADLIAGLPYEDKKSFINTFNQTYLLFVKELQLGFLKELKGTKISLTKNEHNYNFSNLSPYEVIENKYISKEDLDEIRLVEEGLEKLHNKGYFPNTNLYVFFDLKFDPYHTFLGVTNYIKALNLNYKSMQVSDIARMYYEYLSQYIPNKEKLLFIIKRDYLSRFKSRPKIWWTNDITKNERNLIYQEFVNAYPELNLNELYQYGKLEKYNNEYFIIIYYSDVAKVYYFTKK